MGDGGGNDGYEQRQAETEAKKQAARDALNRQFGIATEGPRPATTRRGPFGLPLPDDSALSAGGTRYAPDRAQFTKEDTPGHWAEYNASPEAGNSAWVPGSGSVFDEAGFNASQSAYDAQQAETKQAGNSRDSLYQTVRDNAFNSGRRRLDEQKGDASRKLKFELFARGLNGGSEDINQNALLGRTYQQGVMDLGAKADGAKAQFRGDDENTRLSLLQAIDSGTDQGSAISSAMNQMGVNADRAAAEASGTTLGDLFSTGDLLFNKSKAAQGKAAGSEWWNDFSSSGRGGKSSAARAGQITEV